MTNSAATKEITVAEWYALLARLVPIEVALPEYGKRLAATERALRAQDEKIAALDEAISPPSGAAPKVYGLLVQKMAESEQVAKLREERDNARQAQEGLRADLKVKEDEIARLSSMLIAIEANSPPARELGLHPRAADGSATCETCGKAVPKNQTALAILARYCSGECLDKGSGLLESRNAEVARLTAELAQARAAGGVREPTDLECDATINYVRGEDRRASELPPSIEDRRAAIRALIARHAPKDVKP